MGEGGRSTLEARSSEARTSPPHDPFPIAPPGLAHGPPTITRLNPTQQPCSRPSLIRSSTCRTPGCSRRATRWRRTRRPSLRSRARERPPSREMTVRSRRRSAARPNHAGSCSPLDALALLRSEFTVIEQVAVSALDLGRIQEAHVRGRLPSSRPARSGPPSRGSPATLARSHASPLDWQDAIEELYKRFPGSPRTTVLGGMLLEARGLEAEARTHYERMLAVDETMIVSTMQPCWSQIVSCALNPMADSAIFSRRLSSPARPSPTALAAVAHDRTTDPAVAQVPRHILHRH